MDNPQAATFEDKTAHSDKQVFVVPGRRRASMSDAMTHGEHHYFEQHGSTLEERCTDNGLSPTYYNDGGDDVLKTKKTTYGSPVFNDSKRIFFPHQRSCDCNGSGMGCDCCYTCSC